ncbi:Uncharacterized protein OS=Planctomyces maris DSM 8797 GN=PM8797T_01744 PE=4 SV=1 [Gemmata massiliana]|uniref:Uncharacterized protein n=1 Tax=Gemmata massiliana TaxID=1210884 RepID=A0A6P2CTX4_9BACT|nr:hypothetical protein [Gemmata massiliana]VTR91144.1 Uncharacterized protein OS=Planctomyces maris DSM 8797 GN=PM8797T_01744 PE=4 SV=1 [Gemmata massiliana]
MKLVVKTILVLLALTSVSIMAALQFHPGAATEPPPPPVFGDATIRAKAGASDIVIRTTARTAGAIHSLAWGGKEFVDSFDHGRQIQSASNFDSGKEFIPEVFNPTEAGSLADGRGPTSTSKLLELSAKENELTTLNRMAFWLKPGEKSLGNPARNSVALSDHYLAKRVTIGYKGLPHAIEYRTTFLVPNGEKHTYAQFEAVTGYMPAEFNTFLRFDSKKGQLLLLTDGPGEQADPVVLATADRKHAMGVYAPELPSKGFEGAGYGRFRFVPEKVVKWNCVFRLKNQDGVPGGDHQFRCFVIVGTAADCEATLAALHKEFTK